MKLQGVWFDPAKWSREAAGGWLDRLGVTAQMHDMDAPDGSRSIVAMVDNDARDDVRVVDFGAGVSAVVARGGKPVASGLREFDMRGYALEDARVDAPAAGAAGIGTAVGFAPVYESRSDLLGGFFFEVIHTGAFSESLRRDDIVATQAHQMDKVLGRNRSGTMRMTEDEQRVRWEADLPDTSYARDLAVTMRRGDVSQCSFIFRSNTGGERWEDTTGPDGEPYLLRHVDSGMLREVCITPLPAYETTQSMMRTLESAAAARGMDTLARLAVGWARGGPRSAEGIAAWAELHEWLRGGVGAAAGQMQAADSDTLAMERDRCRRHAAVAGAMIGTGRA